MLHCKMRAVSAASRCCRSTFLNQQMASAVPILHRLSLIDMDIKSLLRRSATICHACTRSIHQVPKAGVDSSGDDGHNLRGLRADAVLCGHIRSPRVQVYPRDFDISLLCMLPTKLPVRIHWLSKVHGLCY